MTQNQPPLPGKTRFSDALLKDPAMGNLGYDRIENEFYPTPTWITENAIKLLTSNGFLDKNKSMWECADGQGHISSVFHKHKFHCFQSDLHPQHPNAKRVNFLTVASSFDGLIFTNPPYGPWAEKFVRHALYLTKMYKGKVGMILRNDWDCAKTRMDLFRDHPAFYGKIVLTTRPRWIEGTTGAPRHNFSIFLWDWQKSATVPPVLLYMNKDMTC